MTHLPVSPFFLWALLKKVYQILKSPIKSFFKFLNLIRGLYRYYFKKIKTYNFVIDERLTHNTILKDGTYISHSEYTITMIDSGNFQTTKWYKSENKERDSITRARKVDLQNMPCYDKLDYNVPQNRFTDPLTIVELCTPLKENSKFFVSNEKKLVSEYRYDINYTELSRFDTFSFCLSMTIPREFDRAHKRETLNIAPIYGLYEFVYKIDRQSKDCGNFVPELINSKQHKHEHIKSIYYSGKSWKMYLPKESRLEFKNITD